MNASQERYFNDVYGRYKSAIYGLSFRKTGDHDLSEDITQEVFLALFRKFDEVEDHRAWLFRCARYEIGMALRRNREELVPVEELAGDLRLSYRETGRELRLVMLEILENRSVFQNSRDREIFRLVAFWGFTKVEVARYLGLGTRQMYYYCRCLRERFRRGLMMAGLRSVTDCL